MRERGGGAERIRVVTPKEFDETADVLLYAGTLYCFDEYSRIVKKCGRRYYLAWDFWRGWYGNLEHIADKDWVRKQEEFLVKESDFAAALGVSPQLCAYLRNTYALPTFWLPNCGAYGLEPIPDYRSKKIAIVIGTLTPHRDIRSLNTLTKAFPQWRFILCYRPYNNTILYHFSFPYRENVEIWAWDAYRKGDMKEQIRAAAVGIIDAGRNWFSYYADSQKYYLYNRLGMKVVGVAAPQYVCEPFARYYPHIYTAENLVKAFEKAAEDIGDGYETKDIPQPQWHDFQVRARRLIKILTEEITESDYQL